MNWKSAITALLAIMLLGSGWAQKPKITNAKIDEVAAGTSLKATVEKAQQQSGGQWIGYRIPARPTERTMCCFDSWNNGQSSSSQCCKGCRMDSDHGTSINGTVSDCAPPEPVPYAFVFLKTEDHQLNKARVFSADCPLDFAGLPVHWLDGVKPEESIDLLAGMALGSNGSGGKSLGHGVVMAIAMHDVPAADTALEKLIQGDRPEELRRNAAFWLGVERGKRGVEILERSVRTDPDDRFREQVTFAFSQSYTQGKQEQALKDLIGMAHNDPSPHVRGQAIFWMAQIGGRKQAELITDAIENDPETQVKEKAVFALSQLPDGEGVPLLIGVAKNNKNPAVRKKAMFWLGQSHDSRALAYLEEILMK